MISLQQIRTLEAKVERAVTFIDELKRENETMKAKLESYQSRIDELEILILEYKEDQKEIELGIINALGHLDRLEDAIVAPPGPAVSADETVDEIEGQEILAAAPVLKKKEAELDIF
jgi:chromosome segregation ATPase